MIRFKAGYRYQNAQRYERQLKTPIKINHAYKCPYFEITIKGYLTIHVGYAWNGADCFPDFDWIMEGSMVHDVLLQLVELGVIPESENDAIDNEFGCVIRDANVLPKIGGETLLKFRSWYAKTGTRLANSHKGDGKPIIQIPRPA